MATPELGHFSDYHYDKKTLLEEQDLLCQELNASLIFNNPHDDLVHLKKLSLFESNQFHAIKINELFPGVANPKKIIYSTIISGIAVAEAIYFIIEDEFENACRVSVPLVVNKSQFELGINLVILNPFYHKASNGKYTLIIMDHSNLSLLNLKMGMKPSEPIFKFQSISQQKNTDSDIELQKPKEANNLNNTSNIIQEHPDIDPLLNLSPIKISDTQLILSTPNACDIYIELGDNMFKQWRYIQAIVQYTCAIQVNPSDATFYKSRGLSYLKLHCYEDALIDFDKAKSLQPDSAYYQYLVAMVYNKIGNHVVSLEILQNIKPKENIVSLAIKKLTPKVEVSVENMKGEFDFDVLRECHNEGKETEIGDFIGPIQIQGSTNHGRGMFTTRKVKKGENLCITKATMWSSLGPNMQCSCPNCRLIYLKNNQVKDASMLIEILKKSKLLTVCFISTFDINQKDVQIRLFSHLGYDLHKNLDFSLYPLQKVSDLAQNIYLYHDHYRLDYLITNMTKNYFHHIWLLPSLINHSCVPNAVRLYIGEICIVRALTDIPKGSEVFVSYLPLALFPDVQKRSEYLKFKCECNLCAFERHHEHKQEIQQLIRLEKELASFFPVICQLSGSFFNPGIMGGNLDNDTWLLLKNKAFRLVRLLSLSTRNKHLISVSFQSIIFYLFRLSLNQTEGFNLVKEAEAFFSELDPETYVKFWAWCNQASRAHLDPDHAIFKLIQKKFNEARKLFF